MVETPLHLEEQKALERKRSASRIFRVLGETRHYKAFLAAFRLLRRPVEFLWRYATGRGAYPVSVEVRTPIGVVSATLFSWHDTRTIHEIFLAQDYEAERPRVVVDFGSNIGISALYFLSRDDTCVVYLHEPVPANLERLEQNLRGYEQRVHVNRVAVGTKSGKVRFGVESTGRYGGIELHTGSVIEVDCVDSNLVLSDVIAKHSAIDVLKVDVETMERAIVEHLTPEIAIKIRVLYVEYPFAANPLAATHVMTRQGTISRFELSSNPSSV